MTGKISRQETRVLIVDDDYEYMNLIGQSLERNGYSKIEDCTDGNDAIRLAGEYKPHVILMDTQLFKGRAEDQPETTKTHGYVACREIRAQDCGKDIAIIGMSSIDYREKWMDAGADDFAAKPFGSEIDDIIQNALEKRMPKQGDSAPVEVGD